MICQKMKLFVLIGILAIATVSEGKDSQWVRVTVLLETGPGSVQRAEDSLVPGGVYSLDEVNRRGEYAVDQEIEERVRFLGKNMSEVEQSMRLGTLMARQYYLELEVGRGDVLPLVDLNPRIGIIITPGILEDDRAVLKVQFLEPKGSPGDPDFTGEPITLRLSDADLQKVLQVFSQVTEIPVDIDPSIDGKVTIDLRDVPWDQAFDLVLRTNDLGWFEEDGVLRVIPLDEFSRLKRVRTDATINLPRTTWGSATIASEGDASNPTVALVVESVDGPPGLVAERDGLVHPTSVFMVKPSEEDTDLTMADLAIFRGVVTQSGDLREVKIISSPSDVFSDLLAEALDRWKFCTVLDEQGRKHEAVVGYGVRLGPTRVMAPIGAIEHIDVSVKVTPSPQNPEKYHAEVLVTDLDAGKVISAPVVRANLGEETTVKSAFVMPNGHACQFVLKLLISEDRDSFRYSWSLQRDGEVVNSHSAEFEL
jgi:hypothetical protein